MARLEQQIFGRETAPSARPMAPCELSPSVTAADAARRRPAGRPGGRPHAGCTELAIVHHLRDQGWHGVWVNSFGPRELRSEWFPAPAVKTLAETGVPTWAVEAFDRLRAANGGTLNGFFDVFAWREPGEVRFCEAKVGPDRVKPTQVRFIELALRFHCSEQFMIIEVAGPSLRSAPGHMPRSAWEAVEQDMRRPMPDQLRSQRQSLLRRAARDLLRELDRVAGPDEQETRETLRDVAAVVDLRRDGWPPE
jgi:hypothetical protein